MEAATEFAEMPAGRAGIAVGAVALNGPAARAGAPRRKGGRGSSLTTSALASHACPMSHKQFHPIAQLAAQRWDAADIVRVTGDPNDHFSVVSFGISLGLLAGRSPGSAWRSSFARLNAGRAADHNGAEFLGSASRAWKAGSSRRGSQIGSTRRAGTVVPLGRRRSFASRATPSRGRAALA